jgi:hypothetical protein
MNPNDPYLEGLHARVITPHTEVVCSECHTPAETCATTGQCPKAEISRHVAITLSTMAGHCGEGAAWGAITRWEPMPTTAPYKLAAAFARRRTNWAVTLGDVG